MNTADFDLTSLLSYPGVKSAEWTTTPTGSPTLRVEVRGNPGPREASQRPGVADKAFNGRLDREAADLRAIAGRIGLVWVQGNNDGHRGQILQFRPAPKVVSYGRAGIRMATRNGISFPLYTVKVYRAATRRDGTTTRRLWDTVGRPVSGNCGCPASVRHAAVDYAKATGLPLQHGLLAGQFVTVAV